ncbi:MAG TPA: polysaccharide deacetylase family protein [Acidobacteriaceae bacterium]|nr:polysaccharide deacetylase family protein [Acidobacteriaceae bacterium]
MSLAAELATGLAAAGAVAATLANAALRPASQVFGHTLIAGNDPREVALTYDDGPNDACTEALLELLDRHNVKATFFMIGRFVRQRPDIARQVHAAGHLVGNHTMTHPWLAWQSARRIGEELRGCQQLLEDALGAPVRYFRPPHGARRPAVFRTAAELGLTIVQWNAMGQDWRPISAAQIVANLDRGLARSRKRNRGANMLLHDGSDVAMGADRSRTVRATELLLERFKRDSSRVVTVDVWK